MRKSLVVFLVAIGSWAGVALADTITFSAPNLTLNESGSTQTGYVDIVATDSADSNTTGGVGSGGSGVTNTNGSDTVTGFSVEVEISAMAGPFPVDVPLLSGSDQTQALAVNPATYIFASNSVLDPGFNGSGTNFEVSNQDFFLVDSPSDSGTVLSSGTPLGLLRLEYEIPVYFVGTVSLTIANNALLNSWYDANNNFNTPNIVDGSIVVLPLPLPEPGSVVLMAIGGLGLLGFHRLRTGWRAEATGSRSVQFE